MIEVTGDYLEDYLDPSALYVITTNGYVKNNGQAVMGAGTAKEAAGLHGDLPTILGDLILAYGNVPFLLPYNFISLPVKRHWKDNADPQLISKSLASLRELWLTFTNGRRTLYLPRPGCGNGGLSWYHVRPLVQSAFADGDDVIIWSLEE